jgi:hypothetical protein
VERFPSDDHLASFFGIVPTSRDSADVKRRGKMTKDGSSIPRWTLSAMVDTIPDGLQASNETDISLSGYDLQIILQTG